MIAFLFIYFILQSRWFLHFESGVADKYPDQRAVLQEHVGAVSNSFWRSDNSVQTERAAVTERDACKLQNVRALEINCQKRAHLLRIDRIEVRKW